MFDSTKQATPVGETTRLFHKILVATDFSDGACSALAQAVWLAKLIGAEVTLAHAIPLTRDTMATFASNPWYVAANAEEIEHRLRHAADRRLREAIAPYRGQGVDLGYKTLWGTPFIEVIHAVQEEGFDLVVAGTRGLSAVSRFFIGSTATRLVRKCPSPVWTVRQGAPEGVRTLLATTDFSEVSRKSVRLAADLARRTGGSLHVLHVDTAASEYGLELFADEEVQASAQRRRRRRKLVEQVREFVRELELPVEAKIVVETGDAWRRILTTARRLSADLTVMGTLARGGVAGMVIGNTAEKVLHAASGSLLAIKPDGFVSPVPARASAVEAQPVGKPD
ncbi:MAG TPA: universal stress protein [Pirellulales bacterium]|nr:universal stress protein [Pirellulales bacterium]